MNDTNKSLLHAVTGAVEALPENEILMCLEVDSGFTFADGGVREDPKPPSCTLHTISKGPSGEPIATIYAVEEESPRLVIKSRGPA